MKASSQLIQVAIKMGLLGALMSIISLLILFYLGRHPLLLNPVLDARWPLMGLFVFFALKMLRDQNNGVLHFWQAMLLGFLIYMIMAQMAAAFIAIFASIDATHFMSSYIAIATEQINVNKADLIDKLGEKTVTDALAMLPNTTASNLAFDYFLKSMPIGLILTLILSTLMRRKGD
ncbi:MAG: DUF4199 domain-containing protein [Cyclobacteriaceae bacterium]|nr:DUF4199 domain-containing protein [Cyclobacteriaceae bacterium]